MLKNDQKRVLICYRNNPLFTEPSHYNAEREIFSYIHPDQAKIFAMFDGRNKFSQVIDNISKKTGFPRERTEKLILPYIENTERLTVAFNEHKFTFPKNFIVPLKDGVPIYVYKENDFECDNLDFNTRRLYSFPTDITLMVNTICQTDCIYCYADCRKKMDCQIPVETLDKLLNDCKKNRVRSFNLMGGEILLYKNWRWLVEKMVTCGYTPYISTKIPVDSHTIRELCDFGIKKIQISLDSFDADIIEKNLHITRGSWYIERMKATLNACVTTGMDLHIHSVITKYNKDITHLKRFLNEFVLYDNIKQIQLSVATESLYKEGYDNHKLNSNDTEILSEYVDEIKKNRLYPFIVNLSTGFSKKQYICGKSFKAENFKKRGLCGANVMQLFILPDGNVTICEELMFHPQFILGNVIKQDLKTIWKNNRLKSLEEKLSYTGSRCGKCKEFANCKGLESRGVCWKEILHAYGSDKWNYPDPKCSHAPAKMRPFYIE
jgi:radical SAM protein with 4Fe4S-binding SPASM domain